jgi:2-oxoglutarate dehydrogenase E1 component
MDKYSFLNTAHTSFFADLYDKYLINPDSIEPSWRAFFQGFDFGMESALDEVGIDSGNGSLVLGNGNEVAIPEVLQKEFQVIRLIDGYRSRGHLFTKTNPVRERRQYSPTLEIANFGLTEEDLDTFFSAGEIIGIGKNTLREIINHLQRIYCDAIGVEYMYIRNPERVKWIQEQLNINDNHPDYSPERKRHILKKLN